MREEEPTDTRELNRQRVILFSSQQLPTRLFLEYCEPDLSSLRLSMVYLLALSIRECRHLYLIQTQEDVDYGFWPLCLKIHQAKIRRPSCAPF